MIIRSVRPLLVALVAALVVLAGAGPAAAHAELIGTDPVDGAVLPVAPDDVTLTFNEAVLLTDQRITVYDARADEVESVSTANGPEVVVSLPGPELVDGTYVVAWFVVSADGHPISGSFRFSVGEASAGVVPPPPAPSSSRPVVAAGAVLQALTYLGLLTTVGLAVFAAFVLPGRYEATRVRRRLRGAMRVAAVPAVVGAILQVPVAAVYAQGLEAGDLVGAFDASLVRNEMVSALFVVLGLGCVLVAVPARPLDADRRLAVSVGAGLALVGPAIVGHTRAYEPVPLLVVTDVLHLAAGSVWLGGLIGLGLSLRLLAGREQVAAETLARFSVVAGGLVLAVAGSGAILAWRILGSWSGFVDTRYGVLLLVKLGLVALVVAAGAWNRYVLLPRVRRGAGPEDGVGTTGLVARAVTVEALVLVAVLGVTGVLVGQPPRVTPAAGAPVEREDVAVGEAGDLRVLVEVTPGLRGGNTLTVRLQDRDGDPVEPRRDAEVQLRTEGLDLGIVPLGTIGPGAYSGTVLLPKAGTWDVQVSVRLGRFENPVTTVRVDVGDTVG